MWGYLLVIAQGIPTSLSLMAVSLMIAFVLAIIFTFLLSMENKFVKSLVNGYLMLFTGTPLLVQFFLIYSGPGQFGSRKVRFGHCFQMRGFVQYWL